MSDEKPEAQPLTLAIVREIARKLQVADALASGSGWLRIDPDGSVHHVPLADVWESPPQ